MTRAVGQAPRVPEKVHQAHGVRLLRRLGATVYTIGTRRRKGDYQGTMQSAGIADVVCFLPLAPGAVYPVDGPRPRVALWWEVKAEGGRLSPAQIEFRACCEQAGVPYVSGDLDRLIAWLLDAGYLKRDHVPFYRLPDEAPRA